MSVYKHALPQAECVQQQMLVFDSASAQWTFGPALGHRQQRSIEIELLVIMIDFSLLDAKGLTEKQPFIDPNNVLHTLVSALHPESGACHTRCFRMGFNQTDQ
jgi:hypothetical protein